MSPVPVPEAAQGIGGSVAVRRPLYHFFAVVLALSLPFWWVALFTRRELIPSLPVSALMAVCPLLAALILVRRDKVPNAVLSLLARSCDHKRIRDKRWYAAITLFMPCVSIITYALLRVRHVPMPILHVSAPALLAMTLTFYVGAVTEELGWSGYITEPMQARWGALRAGIVLGCVWAMWHVVPYVQAGRSGSWIAWFCLFTVATRVIMVWIFNNTGASVFGAVLFHTMANVSWFLFPNNGSHFDPRVTALITTLAAAIALLRWPLQAVHPSR